MHFTLLLFKNLAVVLLVIVVTTPLEHREQLLVGCAMFICAAISLFAYCWRQQCPSPQ